jgi:hypothetical protein
MDQPPSAILMKNSADDSPHPANARELRLDRLIGRRVLGANNRTVGRLEEVRAEQQGDVCEVTGYVIGTAGLLERLHVGVKVVLGRRVGGYLARWDQIDLDAPERPRLLCPVEELRKL